MFLFKFISVIIQYHKVLRGLAQSIYDGNEDTQSYIFIYSGLLISNGKDCKSTHSKLCSHSNYI